MMYSLPTSESVPQEYAKILGTGIPSDCMSCRVATSLAVMSCAGPARDVGSLAMISFPSTFESKKDPVEESFREFDHVEQVGNTESICRSLLQGLDREIDVSSIKLLLLIVNPSTGCVVEEVLWNC